MRRELVLLFGMALAARVLLSLFQIYYGLHNVDVVFSITALSDFYAFYEPWLRLMSQGLLPYRDILSYTYPPLFIYTLYPFYAIGGVHAASIPIIVADAATAPVVYLLANALTSRRIGLGAGLVYALLPFALFYEGYLWLSNQPMTFFLMLSVYYMRSERPTASFVAYGVSTMFKQEALLVLPAYFAWQVMKYRRRVWTGVVLMLSVIFIVSLPFLLIAGGLYIRPLEYQFLGGLAQVGSNPVTVLGSGPGQNASSLIPLKPCPPVLPSGSAPFACIRYSNPMLTLFLTSLGWMSDALAIPFLILAGSAIIISRRARSQVEHWISYSLACFLMLFAFTVHAVTAYYLIPFYAIQSSSAVARRDLLVPFLTSTASMIILSTGTFPLMMAAVSILVLVALQDQGARGLKMES